MGVKKAPPIDGLIDGGLFDFRTLRVIRLRHVFESLTCRYPSSLLWEDSHESLLKGARPSCTAPRRRASAQVTIRPFARASSA
jgi:hypothetical protein